MGSCGFGWLPHISPESISFSRILTLCGETGSTADLATVGPAVTVTVSSTGQTLVTITAELFNSTNNGICFMGFAVSGATTLAASNTQALRFQSPAANGRAQMSATYLVTGLTSGSNTFTAMYRAVANTCTFLNRNIIVIPY